MYITVNERYNSSLENKLHKAALIAMH
jgi:hypothetical protein